MTDAKRTVLVTGCSTGIGRATANTFLEDDWTVYATARNEADLEELADAGCETDVLDVTEDADVRRIPKRIERETGRLDCLVNNAGYAQFGPLEDVSVEDLHAQFDVNVYGPHRLTRRVLPLMREREDGTIVNVSSVLGLVSFPTMGAYAATKFALEAMSDALRPEVAPFGVSVVLVEPGTVRTNFEERAQREITSLEPREEYAKLYKLFEDVRTLNADSPLAMEPEAVADVILDAATRSNPPARIPVGVQSRFGQTLRFVPSRFRDLVYRLLLGVIRTP